MKEQPTSQLAAVNGPLSNLQDRHEIGAQIAREILASSAPTPHRGFRPLAAGIFDLAERLGQIGQEGDAA